jgi:hypothetical protein
MQDIDSMPLQDHQQVCGFLQVCQLLCSNNCLNPSAWFAVPVSSGHLNPLLRFAEILMSACSHNFKRP